MAALAETRLQTPAYERVVELVGDGGLRSVSTWADEIRKDRSKTAPWHFVNIPDGQRNYVPSRDCVNPREGDCVVAAIQRFRSILADTKNGKPERAEALRFLTHFVADIHQPLHCISTQQGGNQIRVTFLGETVNPFREKPWNLHAVWDTRLIQEARLSEQDHFEKLHAWLKAHPLSTQQRGTVVDLALESHQAAVETALDVHDDGRLGPDYVQRGLSVVEERLARAGMRLATLLNEALVGGGL